MQHTEATGLCSCIYDNLFMWVFFIRDPLVSGVELSNHFSDVRFINLSAIRLRLFLS